MALQLSTGCRDAILGNSELPCTDLTFNDNGSSPDTITDTSSRFLTSGFSTNQTITVSSTSSNDSSYAITAIAAGTLSVATGSFAAEASGNGSIVGDNGGDFKSLFTDGVIYVYTGDQPSDADQAETGTNILIITLSSGAFTPGAPGNGLEWEVITSGAMVKKVGETWSGVGINGGGTAGYFRLYDNNRVQGASTTAIRIDGQVSTSGTSLVLSSTTVTNGATITVDSAQITLPASA